MSRERTVTTEVYQPDLTSKEYRNRIIRSLLRKQRHRCYLCGRTMLDPMKVSRLNLRGATIDHYTPLSRGGGDDPDNLRLAHRICNSAKGDTLPGDMVRRPKVGGGDGLRGGLEADAR